MLWIAIVAFFEPTRVRFPPSSRMTSAELFAVYTFGRAWGQHVHRFPRTIAWVN